MQNTQNVRWFFRGVTDTAHRAIGKSLGLGGMSDTDRLHEQVRCKDGDWTLWDCDNIAFDHIKGLLISARKKGMKTYLYKQVGDDLPERWEEDEEVRQALEERPKKTAQTKRKAKSSRTST